MALGIVASPDENLQTLEKIELSPLEADVLKALISQDGMMTFLREKIDADLVVDQVQVFEPQQNAKGAGVYISFRDGQTGEPAEYGWRIGKALGPDRVHAGSVEVPLSPQMVRVSRKVDFRAGIDGCLGEHQDHLRVIIGSLLDHGGVEKLACLQEQLGTELDLAFIPVNIEVDDVANAITRITTAKEIEGCDSKLYIGVAGEAGIELSSISVSHAEGHKVSPLTQETDRTQMFRVVQIDMTDPATGSPICLEFSESEDLINGDRYFDFHASGLLSTRDSH